MVEDFATLRYIVWLGIHGQVAQHRYHSAKVTGEVLENESNSRARASVPAADRLSRLLELERAWIRPSFTRRDKVDVRSIKGESLQLRGSGGTDASVYNSFGEEIALCSLPSGESNIDNTSNSPKFTDLVPLVADEVNIGAQDCFQGVLVTLSRCVATDPQQNCTDPGTTHAP